MKDDGADEGKEIDSALQEMNPLPDGVPNYMTRAGLQHFQNEVARLEAELAKGSDGKDELKRQLRLNQRALQGALTIPVDSQTLERVVFGTQVQVENEDGEKRIYKIVGVFEADPKSNKISWLSPLAKALLGAKTGDTVVVRLPAGENELEILNVEAISED